MRGVRGSLVAVVTCLAVGVAAPAVALDCLGYEPGLRGLAEGAPWGIGPQPDDTPLWEHFDGVVLGEVLAVSPPRRVGGVRVGNGLAVEVVLEVAGTFGPSLVSPVRVFAPDPMLLGWNPVVGGHYAVPYARHGATLRSELCEPVFRIDAADVPELVAVAAPTGWGGATLGAAPSEPAGTTPGGSPVEAPGQEPGAGVDGGASSPGTPILGTWAAWSLLGAVVLGLLAARGLAVRRARRATDGRRAS